ncbi:MAG: hypothetical protein O7H41_21575 [Planctomycetota bacterium]|nr:hypothetical protein [Planctomycetota bacterium]
MPWEYRDVESLNGKMRDAQMTGDTFYTLREAKNLGGAVTPEASVTEPNDELLWQEVLPPDVESPPEFCWRDHVGNVWTRDEVALLRRDTYFAHVRGLEWADVIRRVESTYTGSGRACGADIEETWHGND